MVIYPLMDSDSPVVYHQYIIVSSISPGQITIIHSPESCGHVGMIPLMKTMIPGFGRTGFGRDEISPDGYG